MNVATPLWPDRFATSPMRVPLNSYQEGTGPDPNYPWTYELVYEWCIDGAAFGSAGYGSIEITEVVNNPRKRNR